MVAIYCDLCLRNNTITTCPDKRCVAPETNTFPWRIHSSLIIYRVSMLSQQSITTSWSLINPGALASVKRSVRAIQSICELSSKARCFRESA